MSKQGGVLVQEIALNRFIQEIIVINLAQFSMLHAPHIKNKTPQEGVMFYPGI